MPNGDRRPLSIGEMFIIGSVMRRKILIGVFSLLSVVMASAQGYDQERVQLANFIQRMYLSAPFQGCRIVDDYEQSYLLSVVELDKNKYDSQRVMNRVAEVKSQRAAGEFLNGSQTYDEYTIRTPKSKREGGADMAQVYEMIRTRSTGFVRQMQLLHSFDATDGVRVFVFCKRVDKQQIEND